MLDLPRPGVVDTDVAVRRRVGLPLAFLPILAGCPPPAPAIDSGVGVSAPTFAEVAPIVEDSCLRCHHPAIRLAGGVDLSSSRAVVAGRIGLVCTSVGPEVIDAFADDLVPLSGTSTVPCDGHVPLSMPPGAQPRLTVDEQVTLARWVARGAPEE